MAKTIKEINELKDYLITLQKDKNERNKKNGINNKLPL